MSLNKLFPKFPTTINNCLHYPVFDGQMTHIYIHIYTSISTQFIMIYDINNWYNKRIIHLVLLDGYAEKKHRGRKVHVRVSA